MPPSAATRKTLLQDLPDTEFVRRISAGDDLAFEALMRKHNRQLYRTARAILRNDADAEDALQKAYLNTYRSIDEFRGHAKLSTWMTRIVVNESMMQLRRRGRHASVVPIDSVTDERGDLMTPDGAAVSGERPEREVLRTQMRNLVERKIDSLPDVYRTVFVLRAVEELSVENTAAALDITESTVRTRFFRARALLRESLASEVDSAIEDAFAFEGSRCDRIVSGVLAQLRRQAST